MEEFKKLLVLITSIALIGLVVYFISIANFPKKEQSTATDTVSIEFPQLEPEPEVQHEDTIKLPPPEPQPDSLITEKAPERDSVNWHRITKGEKREGKDVGSSMLPNPNSYFTKAAARILPAVVSVRSTQVLEFVPEDHPEFFIPGTGSGIIISNNGYVLTNFHVINEARDLHITLYDRREFPAEYIGGDPTTDVALLKIEAEDLPVAYLGNSDNIELGEWVLAVGNPLNFRSTITAGIISALGRDIRIINEEYRIENFIQTDAVINPGNSGGALVNLDGEVIGMNTAIATRTGFNQGYGFAIPSNLARKVVDDIVQYGYVKRGLLGISIDRVNSNTARAMGFSKPKGVLVAGVREGFPAEKSGLQQGDIILSVDGEEVNAPNELQMKIAGNHPGKRVKLMVWRDGRKQEFDVPLAEAPQSETKAFLSSEKGEFKFENLGLRVRELTDEEKDYLESDEGLLVEGIAAGSPAQSAGIFKGDVIVSIDEKILSSKNEFEKIINQATSGTLLKFRIMRKLPRNDDIYNRIVFVEVP